MADSDNNLHSLAVTAETALEKFGTALAQAGAPPDSVKSISQMADVCREMVKVLGAGQEQTAPDEGPAPGAQPTTISDAVDQMPVGSTS